MADVKVIHMGEKEFFERIKLINSHLSGAERFLIYETCKCFKPNGASIVDKTIGGRDE